MTKPHFPYYCLLFAAYPSLALIAHNITEDSLVVVIRPFLFSIFLALVILEISKLLFKEMDKAGLFSLVALILFFSLGHIYQILDGRQFLGIDFRSYHHLVGPALLLLLLAGLAISRIRKFPSFLPNYLLAVAIVLLVFPIYQIVSYSITRSQVQATVHKNAISARMSSPISSSDLPDIYYIILDSYTRQDTLKSKYKFDNQPFLSQLEDRNFYIANCSRSNYQFTLLSLSSTFNMDYLENLDPRFSPGKYRVDFMEELITHSQVRSDLEHAGYKIVAFQSSYGGTTITDADELVTYSNNSFLQTVGGYINPFEEMFINTTAGMAIYHLPAGKLKNLVTKISFPYSEEAKIQIFQLDTLPKVAIEPGPKFVFMHMNIPHKPFIFRADGQLQTDPAYYAKEGVSKDIKGYTDQIEFLNSRLPAIVDVILAQSEHDPIIIIQGDHGMDVGHRSTILNAYHVPPSIQARLYPSITPVNTYRIILSELLGKNYPVLPDRSFASKTDSRFDITENFETNQACLPQ